MIETRSLSGTIYEDVDGDGKADKSSVFADNLHIPLSFEFGDGGVYVSEMPDLTFLKDTDGDGAADVKQQVYTGFSHRTVQAMMNSFRWGIDCRIHGATSSSGATVSIAASE